MSFNIVKEDGSLERVAGLSNSEKIDEMYEAFPSDASASNKLLSYKSLQLYADYQSNNTRVVRIEYSSNLATRLHLITEPGAALRDVFIQLATRNPFVTVYDMGVSSLFTIKTALVSNKRVIYINVGTSDGSVIINQDDVSTDGYGNLLLPTVTLTNTSDEEWTSATAITPIKLRPTSIVTSGSTAPITSGAVFSKTKILNDDYQSLVSTLLPNIKSSADSAGDYTAFNGYSQTGREGAWWGFRETSSFWTCLLITGASEVLKVNYNDGTYIVLGVV